VAGAARVDPMSLNLPWTKAEQRAVDEHFAALTAAEHECPKCHCRDMVFGAEVCRAAEGQPWKRVPVGGQYWCARCGTPLVITKAGVMVPSWVQEPADREAVLRAMTERNPQAVVDSLMRDVERPTFPGV